MAEVRLWLDGVSSSPLVLRYDDPTKAARVMKEISSAATSGVPPSEFWYDDDGYVVAFQLKRLMAMELSPH